MAGKVFLDKVAFLENRDTIDDDDDDGDDDDSSHLGVLSSPNISKILRVMGASPT